jgi:drug/metabolite transporter (DMT)-like permease
MKKIKYILMVLLGGTLYGTMSSFVKMSYTKGFNAAEISFWQALLAAFFLSICAIASPRKAEDKKMSRKEVLPLLATGSAIGLTNYLYYLSVSYISASLAIVLLMQYTWFSIIIEWLCFKRKPSKIEILTALVIWIGTLLAGNLLNARVINISWKGLLLAGLSSLTYAIYIIANSCVGKTVRWQSKSALIMWGSALTIFCINAQTLVGSCFSRELMETVLFLAIFGTTIPTALFSAGIPKVGATVSSILMTIEFPVAVLFAHFLLKENIGNMQLVGIAAMLGAICIMNYHKAKRTL